MKLAAAVLVAGVLLTLGAGLGLESMNGGLGAGPVGAAPVGSVRLGAAQEEGAALTSSCSGLDWNVVRAWFLAEGNQGSPGQPLDNFAFIGGAGGPGFASPAEGARAICRVLAEPAYAGIRAAAGEAPILQLLAIAASPWDGGFVAWGDPAGHYGGDGRNLLAAYDSLMGALPETCRSGLCAQ